MNKVTSDANFQIPHNAYNSFVNTVLRRKDNPVKAARHVPRPRLLPGQVWGRLDHEQLVGQFFLVGTKGISIEQSVDPEVSGDSIVHDFVSIRDDHTMVGITGSIARRGDIIPVTLFGATPVKVSVTDEAHKFAKLHPTSSFFVTSALLSSESGLAEILWKEPGRGIVWAVVLLRILPASGDIQPVNLKVTNPSSPHSVAFAYNVTNFQGVQVLSNINPSALPHTYHRPVPLAVTTAATFGYMTVNATGDFSIIYCNEVVETGLCQ